MKKDLVHTLAASVMLAATAGLTASCTSNDDNPVSPINNSQWGAETLEFAIGDAGIKVKKVAPLLLILGRNPLKFADYI